MILYPPLIDNKVPGFVGQVVKINFTHNPAVSTSQVKQIFLLVKDIINSSIIETASTSFFNLSQGICSFILTETYTTGNYYKFQIAYNDSEENINNLNYSSVAIGKYLDEQAPEIKIDGLSAQSDNFFQTIYNGIYNGSIDEPAYQYKFIFSKKNKDNNLYQIVKETDWLFCKENKAQFKIDEEIDSESFYKITFSIITINGYEASVSYNIIYRKELPTTFPEGGIMAYQDNEAIEEGYNLIKIINPSNKNIESSKENYELLRKRTNGSTWEHMAYLSGVDPSNMDYIWKDYSIEHGVKYQYAIRDYNLKTNLFSEKTNVETTNPTEFYDCFLLDSEKQLKIKFNPKISNFKENVAESKIETLGSKYPYFFKNGNIKYKEFSISGLISHNMDENKEFFSSETTTNYDFYSCENLAIETEFRKQVLDWLNNGKLKIYKSSTEGNFIVRLTNISLSPNDTLGRVLYSFSATCVEMDDYNYENLLKNNLIRSTIENNNSSVPTITPQINYKSEIIPEGRTLELTSEYPKYLNIVYSTSDLNLSTSYITIDGISILNTTGVYTTPIGETYSTIKCSDTGATIYYGEIEEVDASWESKFEGNVKDDISFTVIATMEGEESVIYYLEDSKTLDSTDITKYIWVRLEAVDSSVTDTTCCLKYKGKEEKEIIISNNGSLEYYENALIDLEYFKLGSGIQASVVCKAKGAVS